MKNLVGNMRINCSPNKREKKIAEKKIKMKSKSKLKESMRKLENSMTIEPW